MFNSGAALFATPIERIRYRLVYVRALFVTCKQTLYLHFICFKWVKFIWSVLLGMTAWEYHGRIGDMNADNEGADRDIPLIYFL